VAIRFQAVIIVLALAVLALAIFAVASNHKLSVHTVGPNGEYQSIQDAIRDAVDGDTIIVSSGTYAENITVDRRLTITAGDDGSHPVIDAGGHGNVIRLLANGVCLKGLVITGSGPDGSGIMIDSDCNRIELCSVHGCGYGINATGRENNTIIFCDVYDDRQTGISLAGCRNNIITANRVHECLAGISLRQSVNDTIRENNASDNSHYGIRLQGSDGNTIANNTIHDSGDKAIDIAEGSDWNVISGNDIGFDASAGMENDRPAAIDVNRSRNNTVAGNRLTADGEGSRDTGNLSARSSRLISGILLSTAEDCLVKDNVMIGGRYGIWIDRSKNSTVTGNRVSGGYYDISVEESSSGIVEDNVLKDSEVCLWVKGSDRNVIRNNTMSGAGLADNSGYVLALEDSWYNTIENNTLSASPRVHNSIRLSNASYNTLKGNRDSNNGGKGIGFADGSTGNRAYLNDFLGHVTQVTPGNFWSSPGKVTYTYHGKTFTGYLGNLWPDYPSLDAGGNGVGDIGYPGPSFTDKYPLMESFTSYDLDTSSPPALPYSGVFIGFHESKYGIGISPFPAPEAWYTAGKIASDKFSGSTIGAVWVIGCARSDGASFLNFPSTKQYPEIRFSATDENEEYLDYFDDKGVSVILQVEPGNANVDDLIRLVLDRYSHHPSVAGLGIDVEWYRFSNNWQGKPVSDEEAEEWYNLISSYNKSYVLTLTHWLAGKMPPTYREGIYFLYDGYNFNSHDDMMSHYTSWGKSFSTSPVGFYLGFPEDRQLRDVYTDPYETIGQDLLNSIENTKAIYWINGQYPRT
jgi:parallel beta-helix repeat protein